MDSFHAYIYSTSAWYAIQAIPLLISPRLLVAMLEPRVRDVTDLETHLSHLLSLALLTLSLLTFLLSGAITLSTSPLPSSDTVSASTSTSPYTKTILILTALHHAATASFSYARYAHTGQSAFGVGVLGSGGLAAMGGWVLMFGLQGGGGSRSRWPFENAGERERRKERRREKFGVGVVRKGL